MDTVSLLGVEVLRTGRWNGREYGGADLDDLVESYKALCPDIHEAPGKLGHNEDQALASTLADGGPAVGWITRLYRVGNSLLADYRDVPKTFASLIQKGAYKKRSAEIMFNAEFGGKVWPAVLRAVAWLGEATPAVKGMSDIVAMYTDAEGHKVEIVTLAYEFSQDEIRRAVCDELYECFPYLIDWETGQPLPGAMMDGPSPDVRDIYADSVIVWDQDHDSLFRIPYTMDDAGECSLGEPVLVRVEYSLAPTPAEAMMADTTMDLVLLAAKGDAPAPPTKTKLLAQFQSYLDALEGVAAGKKGVSEMRVFFKQAIKTIKGMSIPDEAKNASTAPAATATTQPKEAPQVDEKELRQLLNIGDDVDIKAHLLTMTASTVSLADHEAAKAELASLAQRLNEREANEAIESAITEGKLRPAMREWGVTTYLTHKDTWAGFLAVAPKVNLTQELGSGSGNDDAPEALPKVMSDIASRMGISPERLSDTRSFAERRAELTAAKA